MNEYVPVSLDWGWNKPIPMINNGDPNTPLLERSIVWAETIVDVLATLPLDQKYSFYMEGGIDPYPLILFFRTGHRVFITPDNTASTKKRKELGWKKLPGKQGDEQDVRVIDYLRLDDPDAFTEITDSRKDVIVYRFLAGRYRFLNRGNAKLKQLWGANGILRRRYGPVKEFTDDIAELDGQKIQLLKEAQKLVNPLIQKIDIKGIGEATLIQFIAFHDPRRFSRLKLSQICAGFNEERRNKGNFGRTVLSILHPCLVQLKRKTSPLRPFYDETKKGFQAQGLTCADCYHHKLGHQLCRRHPQIGKPAKPENPMCKGQIERKVVNRLKQKVHDMIWEALHDDYSVPIITKYPLERHIKDPEVRERVVKMWDENAVYDEFFSPELESSVTEWFQ